MTAMTEQRRALLALLRQKPRGWKAKQLREVTGQQLEALQRLLGRMKDAGQVFKIGGGQVVRWGCPEHAETIRAAYNAEIARRKMLRYRKKLAWCRDQRRMKPVQRIETRYRKPPAVTAPNSVWALAA